MPVRDKRERRRKLAERALAKIESWKAALETGFAPDRQVAAAAAGALASEGFDLRFR
jgi:hypothetical protein